MPDPRRVSSIRFGKLGMPRILGFLKQKSEIRPDSGPPGPRPIPSNPVPPTSSMESGPIPPAPVPERGYTPTGPLRPPGRMNPLDAGMKSVGAGAERGGRVEQGGRLQFDPAIGNVGAPAVMPPNKSASMPMEMMKKRYANLMRPGGRR